MNNHAELAQKIISGYVISREEARTLITRTAEQDVRALAEAANTIRKTFAHNTIDFCALINAKSGACSEDCAFCAQSGHHASDIVTHGFIDIDTIVAKARAAEKYGAQRFCIVTSGGALTDEDFDKVITAYREIKKQTQLKIDGSLGFLTEKRVHALKTVGLSRFNHNLETSRRYYEKICTTHSYDDRLRTIRLLKQHGIEVCCGGIIGMGETLDDRIDLAFTLKEEGVSCIPINILNPRKNTPLEHAARISSLEAVASIAVFRLINPATTIKIAGGREEGLGKHQQLSLEAGGNGFIIGGYLTTIGNKPEDDIQIARNAGYEI